MARQKAAASWRTVLLGVVALFSGVEALSLNACSRQNFGAANPSFNSYVMTASTCAKDCSGHQFAIVQAQNCWCSDYFTSSTTSLSNCAAGCPGWPAESCAGSGYFGYIALNAQGSAAVSNAVSNAPGGGGAPATSAPVSSAPAFSAPASSAPAFSAPVSSAPPPAPTSVQITTSTAVVSSVNIVVSTSYAVMTSTQVMTSPPQQSSSTPSSSTPPPDPVTSVEIVTVSGAVVYSTVTLAPVSTASRAPSSGAANSLPQPESHGLSNGAVAGITIGSIAGAAIAGALLWFFCFKRRPDNDEENGSMRRHPSVLSKVGLLRGDSTHLSSAVRRQQPPSLQTSGIGNFSGPASATTGNSRDMTERGRAFVDSRLNPNTIMMHANASRSSIGTLQDNQDYSRPLEVRNPDA